MKTDRQKIWALPEKQFKRLTEIATEHIKLARQFIDESNIQVKDHIWNKIEALKKERTQILEGGGERA